MESNKSVSETIKTGFYEYDGCEESFQFYTRPNLLQQSKFVKAVTDLVVDDDYYIPLLKDTMFDFGLIVSFSTVDTTEIKDDLATVEKFVEETKVAEIIKANLDKDILDKLNNNVDSNIAYKTGIKNNDTNDYLCNILKNVNGFIEKFSNIDMAAVGGFMEKMSGMNGEINSESLVKAYMESDEFKNGQKEIIDEKDRRINIMEQSIIELAAERNRQKGLKQ